MYLLNVPYLRIEQWLSLSILSLEAETNEYGVEIERSGSRVDVHQHSRCSFVAYGFSYGEVRLVILWTDRDRMVVSVGGQEEQV